MATKSNIFVIVEQLKSILGNDFRYPNDTDVHGYYVPQEEHKTIMFLYRPVTKKNGNYTMMDDVVSKIKNSFPQHDIWGGRTQYDGWIVILTVRSLEDIENEMTNLTKEYNQNMEALAIKAIFLREKGDIMSCDSNR